MQGESKKPFSNGQKILQEIIKGQQLPLGCRIGLVGPTGAGKSTLVNVLIGANKAYTNAVTTGTFTPEVYTVSGVGGDVVLVDLPGLDDPYNPQFVSYVQEELKKCDAAILVMNLTNRANLEILSSVKRIRPSTGLGEQPLIAVFTHTDKLDKVNDIYQIGDWENDDSQQAQEIRKFVYARKEELEKAKIGTITAIPIAAPSQDDRARDWNTAQLWQAIIDALPLAKNFVIARTLSAPETRYKTAIKILETAGEDLKSAVEALAIIYTADGRKESIENKLNHFENRIGVPLTSKELKEKIEESAKSDKTSIHAWIIKTFDELPDTPPLRLPPISEKDLDKAEARIEGGFVRWVRKFLQLLPGNTGEILVAVYLTFKDPRVPLLIKGLLASTLIYVITPLDAVPDLIPYLGLLDDIVAVMLTYLRNKEIIDKHIPEASKWLEGKGNNLY